MKDGGLDFYSSVCKLEVSCKFAVMSDGKHRVSFDKVIVTMRRTGKDLPSLYRETSEGGLAIDHL